VRQLSKTGLTVDQYVSFIKVQLGGGIVNVEVEEIIPDILEIAFIEINNNITSTEMMTVPFQTVIDLTDKKVADVVYIMRGRNTNGPGGFQDVMYIYSRQSAMNSYTLTDYSRALMANQNKSALSTDLDFHYDKREEKLFLYAQQALPTTVTLCYIPEYSDVSEIIDPFWQNLLKRLALALTKETLGRVRGKYKLDSALYNLDSDQLLSEAQAELSEIRNYLDANTDVLLPID